MNTELDALYNLISRLEPSKDNLDKAIVDIRTIETALKKGELATEFCNNIAEIVGNNDLDEIVDIVEKEHKALEIIKEKDVSMYWLRNSKSVDEYNNFILTDKRQYQKLTNEEYDFLKKY